MGNASIETEYVYGEGITYQVYNLDKLIKTTKFLHLLTWNEGIEKSWTDKGWEIIKVVRPYEPDWLYSIELKGLAPEKTSFRCREAAVKYFYEIERGELKCQSN